MSRTVLARAWRPYAQAKASLQAGFTLIELIIAMTVFSMALLIVVSGFLTLLNLRDQAIAMNTVQDNARTSMDQILQAVRDSSSSVIPVAGGAPGDPLRSLCLPSSNGQDQFFQVTAAGILTRSDSCVAPTNTRPITSSKVKVTQFRPVVAAVPAKPGAKPAVEITLTVGSANALGADGAIYCGTSVSQRSFCNVVTLTSGGTPR